MRQVYLDYAATTPVRDEVVAAMAPYHHEFSGNPSSKHSYGAHSKKAMLGSHDRLAACIGAKGQDIVFTGSGTEANNTVIKGVADAQREKGRHIITTTIEHHAVTEPCRFLMQRGCEVTFLPVDGAGRLDPGSVAAAIRPDTILISVILANNEVGTLQDMAAISVIAREHGVPLHSDAVQALGHIPIDVTELGVDYLTASAHKIYGPKGVGMLYLRPGSPYTPLLHGGGHERGLRSSTPNVPGAVGFATALELACGEMAAQTEQLEALRARLRDGLQEICPELAVNGHATYRLPHILNLRFPSFSNDDIIAALDGAGVYTSRGAACGAASKDPSEILLALGLSVAEVNNSVRFSFGRWNALEDIDYVLEVFPEILAELKP